MTHAQQGATLREADGRPAPPPAAGTADLPRRALDYLTDGILLLDDGGDLLYLNPAAERLLGASGALPGTPWPGFLDPGSDADLVQETLAGGPGGERTTILRTPEGLHTVDMACTPLPEGGALLRLAPNRGAGIESEVLYRARHDPVTGTYNRWELEKRLGAALRRSLETSLAILDLDRFKEVNDRAGHAAGDTLLQRIARGLDRRLRDTDIVARLGGDEFAVLLPGCGPDAGGQRLEGLLAELTAEPFCHADMQFGVTVSAGIARVAGDAPETVLAAADRACYAAKAAGGGRVVVATAP